MKDIKPNHMLEYTIDLYPHNGFLILFAITSATIPKSGNIKTYTSGCAKTKINAGKVIHFLQHMD